MFLHKSLLLILHAGLLDYFLLDSNERAAQTTGNNTIYWFFSLSLSFFCLTPSVKKPDLEERKKKEKSPGDAAADGNKSQELVWSCGSGSGEIFTVNFVLYKSGILGGKMCLMKTAFCPDVNDLFVLSFYGFSLTKWTPCRFEWKNEWNQKSVPPNFKTTFPKALIPLTRRLMSRNIDRSHCCSQVSLWQDGGRWSPFN